MSQYERLVSAILMMPQAAAYRTRQQLSTVATNIKKQSKQDEPSKGDPEHFVRLTEEDPEKIQSKKAEPERKIGFILDQKALRKQEKAYDEQLERSNKSEIVHKPATAKIFVNEGSDTDRVMSLGKHECRIVNHVVDYSIANPQHSVSTTIRTRKQIKHQKVHEVDNRRKNLMGQLTKLESQLQDLAQAKDNLQVAHDNPSIRALEFVRKMNEERKRREERVRIQTDRIKRARAEREEAERKRQEQLERINQLRREQQQAEQRRRDEQINERKRIRHEQEVHKMASDIVRDMVSLAVGDQQSLADSPTKESNSSRVLVRSRHIANPGQDRYENVEGVTSSFVGKSRVRPQPSNRSSNSRKKELPEIVLKLDKKKHVYPSNIFRQQILQEERRKRQLERQLEEQKRKVVDMRRVHNLPPIRSRNLISMQSSNVVVSDSLRHSSRPGKPLLSEKEESAGLSHSHLATISLKTEEAESPPETVESNDKKDQQSPAPHIEAQSPTEELPLSQDPLPESTTGVEQQAANRLKTNESDVQQDFEMQFFKSSNPVPEAEPEKPTDQPSKGQQSTDEPQQQPTFQDKVNFFKLFNFASKDENETMRGVARNALAEKEFSLESNADDYDSFF